VADDTFHELRLIRSRLEAIEHTQEVLVRADAAAIWGEIETAFEKEPLLADVYQLIGGGKTQQELVSHLKEKGASATSQPTVSRALRRLREDLQIVTVVEIDSRGTVYGHTRLHRILGLDRRINSWRSKREKPRAE
jgi:DNA-binding transcriptional ArsR family regulator